MTPTPHRDYTRENTADDLSVLRFQSGDESAFRELFDRHVDRAKRIALRIVHSDCDAEEVAQDTFLRIYRHLPAFRRDCTFATWLHYICKRLALNRLGVLRRRHTGVDSLDAPIEEDSDMTSHDLIASSNPPPIVGMETDELMEHVQRGLSRVTPAHRDVLVMRIEQDFKYREIAHARSVGLQTLRGQLKRARVSLRKHMPEEVFAR